jgi:membrane carboxypeptidase/penicillin-binding protein
MMHLRILGKGILGLGLAITLYLIIVAMWASVSVSYVLPKAPTGNELPLLTLEQKEILLKIEDPTFYNHAGLDISLGQGLTTITSSLARDIFLFGSKLSGIKGGFQSFYRGVFNCCKKVDFGRDVMALVLNRNLSKDQQLHLFVSSVYMGSYKGIQIHGLAAAAEKYFKQPLLNLSNEDFITLVAMLKAPNYFHPSKGLAQLKSRTLRISKILAGECKPSGWFDTTYRHCTNNA